MDEETGEIKIVDHLVSFAWTFDWALCQVKKNGECITSPSFSTLLPDNTSQEWKLQLYPDGVNRKFRGNLSIYLRTADSKKHVSFMKLVTFNLRNSHNEEVHKIYSSPLAKPKPPVVSCQDQFIRKEMISNNSDLLHFGKLTLVCTIMEIRTDMKYGLGRKKLLPDPEPVRPLTPLSPSRSLVSLTISDDEEEREESQPELPSDSFEALLVTGWSDVTIAAGDRCFHAHRAILSARSPFFQCLFEQDIAQCKRVSFVDMREFDGDVIVELLRYVYLDRVEELVERAKELLGPANKYALEKLKAVCEAVMIKELSVDNASEYLVLSFLHEAVKLQKKAMDFVASHSLDVFNTPGFKAIAGSHANVITALLKTVATKGKEDEMQKQTSRNENDSKNKRHGKFL